MFENHGQGCDEVNQPIFLVKLPCSDLKRSCLVLHFSVTLNSILSARRKNSQRLQIQITFKTSSLLMRAVASHSS